jgi:cytochrome c553
MKNYVFAGLLTLLTAFAALAQFPPVPPPKGRAVDLAWAFPVADKVQPPAEDLTVPKKVPDSDKTYTQKQIDDGFNPPDWFPTDHSAMPQVVAHGSMPIVRACALCHLASGQGHPESANIAGLSAAYMERQFAAFKSQERINGGAMVAIAQNISDDDLHQALSWFSALNRTGLVKVKETTTVPKTRVNAGRMRLPVAGGATEPLGKRIIELPQNMELSLSRDPHSGTIAYVPVGSLVKGKALVTTGGLGKTTKCMTCHGAGLIGLAEVPRIAGDSPLYITRQLFDFQTGVTPGTWPELMKGVVAKLSDDDIISIAAYVASLPPAPVATSSAAAAK